MTIEVEGQTDLRTIAGVTLGSSLIIVLPGVEWALFGWLHMLLPLLAFLLLNKYGAYTGKRFLLAALALSALVFMVLKSLDLLFFSALLLLSGFVLFSSARTQQTPAMGGLKASGTLAAGWVLGLVVFTFGAEASTYSLLIASLDQGIGEAVNYYRQSTTVSADTLVMLETTLQQMRVILPIVMPAILGSLILFITWFTMVIGNSLLARTNKSSPWPRYGLWQLPEKLIWVVIAAALASLTPVHLLRFLGINALMLLGIIYCFQGLSVAVFYMDKWKVPTLLRSFFYVMMILQSFGTIVLLILGITDIWFDYRKLKIDLTEEENDSH